jgi:hypothetical protein
MSRYLAEVMNWEVLKKGMLRQVDLGASVSVILHLRISWPSISDCSFHDMMPSKGPRLTFTRLAASQLRLNLVPHLESLLVGSHNLSLQQTIGVGRFGNSVSQQEAPAVLMHDRCRAKAGPRGTVQVGPGNAQDMQQIIGCNLQTAAADRNRFPKELDVPPRSPANRRCLAVSDHRQCAQNPNIGNIKHQRSFVGSERTVPRQFCLELHVGMKVKVATRQETVANDGRLMRLQTERSLGACGPTLSSSPHLLDSRAIPMMLLPCQLPSFPLLLLCRRMKTCYSL